MTAHDLSRFVDAQDRVWTRVVAELGAGEKRSHWIWFVFPQLVGLGRSATAERFGIDGIGEARAYLDHATLRARLEEATELMLTLDDGVSLRAVLGTPDDLKFRSSMTLFEAVTDGMAHDGAPYRRALARFCGGERDGRTLTLLPPPGAARATAPPRTPAGPSDRRAPRARLRRPPR